MRILLVEDDEMLGGAVRDHLGANGHATDWMLSIADAAHARATTSYDLVLLDLGLPDGSGLGFLRALRRMNEGVPVIILTAMDQLTTRIDGLNAGADDYLVKPFDLGELLARVSAVSRRYTGNANPLIKIGPLTIDQARRTAAVDGQGLDLTAREWAILDRLAQHPGVVISKAQLEDALFEFGAEVESNAVEVYVSRLRKKLGHHLIHTSRGMGYRLAAS
ncbi:MAG: DNA-binding response regulator [Devosia sp. 67-54]|uniref:response regulator transcription factor n=1 Tax=unclassified Devosia TaxID=196773 RepID=UPI00095CB114|nr:MULTISPECIES: response regulator transcription factor [unclassified Devosia]MBN9305977.1 response regulator transcription factor [Devosia sp.]OJX16580.1 MAG: DNA-binding response regulator [Devosia sp. 67-54]